MKGSKPASIFWLLSAATFLILGVRAQAENQSRFIVWTDDLGALDSQIKGSGASLHRHMKFESAAVVLGSESAVSKLASRLGGHYEKDVEASISGKATPTPTPTPTPSPTVQPAQTVPYGIDRVRAREAASRGAGVKVCVTDTGIDLTHPDLKDNIIATANTIRSSSSAADDNGHGTHVAGTIAALDNGIGVVGVAPEAKLIIVKGLNYNGVGLASDLAEAIDECRVLGAQVINMSWGTTSLSTAIQSAVQRAYAAGIIMVAAAGNNGAPVEYPAKFPEVVAVSAVGTSDTFMSWSNYGPEVENSAPGSIIYSTWVGSSYRNLSGTSQSTPHVAGVAALMLSVNPAATRDHLLGVDLGLPVEQQGTRGRIDAVLSTTFP